MRAAIVAMVVVGAVVGYRKFGSTPAQDELERYVKLTVPSYLEQIAEARARFEALSQPTDAGPTTPARARAVLVDDVTPRLIALRKDAASVQTASEPVRQSNREFLAAVDAWEETARTAVRVIDDPRISAERGQRLVAERRRAADEAVRAWMENLRKACQKAGFRMDHDDKRHD